MKLLLVLFALAQASFAQSLDDLIPWIPGGKDLSLGMSVTAFQKANDKAVVFSSGEGTPEVGADFTGAFFEGLVPSPALGAMESSIFYSFVRGKLAAVHWSNKTDQTLQLTETVRNVLVKAHGRPLLGHTAKQQGESIAKVTIEAFSTKDSDTCKVVLNSAAKGIEVLAIDFALENRATLADLCFSYEKHAAALKKRGLKELADPDQTIDFLANLREQ